MGRTTLLTKNQVLLEWAAQESVSPRWAARYEAAKSGNETELLEALKRHRGILINKYISPFEIFEIRKMDRASWMKQIIMSEMGWDKSPVTLEEYLHGEIKAKNDPRNIANQLALQPDFEVTGYPIISLDRERNIPVLIEGYTRMLAWIQKNNHIAINTPAAIFCG